MLEHKSDINARDIKKRTPLMMAAYKGHENIVGAFSQINRAQSYQRQIPENFRFSELKILFVIEAIIIVRKLEVFLIKIWKYQKQSFIVYIEVKKILVSFNTNNVAAINN